MRDELEMAVDDWSRENDGALSGERFGFRAGWGWRSEEIAYLTSEVERLRAALEEISEGRGPFSSDQLTFATDTIEAMKELARAALRTEDGETK